MKILAPVLPIFLLIVLCVLGRPDVKEQRMVEADEFKLRVSRLASWDPMSSRYVIESAHENDNWKVVADWSQDDPLHVSDIEIKALNESVGYYFNMVTYGVTTDGGRTWSTFDLYSRMEKDKLNRADHRIPYVQVDQNGFGSIYLKDYTDADDKPITIYTTDDFGLTWDNAR